MMTVSRRSLTRSQSWCGWELEDPVIDYEYHSDDDKQDIAQEPSFVAKLASIKPRQSPQDLRSLAHAEQAEKPQDSPQPHQSSSRMRSQLSTSSLDSQPAGPSKASSSSSLTSDQTAVTWNSGSTLGSFVPPSQSSGFNASSADFRPFGASSFDSTHFSDMTSVLNSSSTAAQPSTGCIDNGHRVSDSTSSLGPTVNAGSVFQFPGSSHAQPNTRLEVPKFHFAGSTTTTSPNPPMHGGTSPYGSSIRIPPSNPGHATAQSFFPGHSSHVRGQQQSQMGLFHSAGEGAPNVGAGGGSSVNPNANADTSDASNPGAVFARAFRSSDSRQLFAYNIPSNISNNDLLSIFRMHGDIQRSYFQRKSIGVVVIVYDDIRHARKALRNTSSLGFGVEFCVPVVETSSSPTEQGVILVSDAYGSNLSPQTMGHLFPPYGEVSSVSNLYPNTLRVEYFDARSVPGALASFNQVVVGSYALHACESQLQPPVMKQGHVLYTFLMEGSRDHGNAEGSGLWSSSPQRARFQGGQAPTTMGHNVHTNEMQKKSKRQHTNNSQGPSGNTARHQHNAGSAAPSGASRKQQSSNQNTVVIDAILSGADSRTSLMIRNIPNKYTQKMLLDDINDSFEGLYDFFYLPIDFKNKCNVGYAFINFIDPRTIVDFAQRYDNQKWRCFNSTKICKLCYARLQGKSDLVARFQNSSLMEREADYLPLVFHTSGPLKGKPAKFPMPQMKQNE